MNRLLFIFAIVSGATLLTVPVFAKSTVFVADTILETNPLVKAIDQDRVTVVQAWIKGGHDPFQKIRNSAHESLIERAATHASTQSFHLIFDSIRISKPQAKLSDARGTPLILTLASLAIPGKPLTPRYEALIQFLLKQDSACAQLQDRAYIGDGRTALHEASTLGNLRVMKMLLDSDADVNAKNSSGETALHLAARFGQLDAARYLMSMGAEVNAKSKFTESTPLMLAAEMGHEAMIRYLMSVGAKRDEKDTFGKTAPERFHEYTHVYVSSRKQ